MNIFYLHKHQEICARMHANKHVVKMILETAQLLCNAHHLYPLHNFVPKYKPTHLKHPCTLWVVASIYHYEWLLKLGLELCKEYSFRYGKTHASQQVLMELSVHKPKLPVKDFEDPPQAMPIEYKNRDCVTAYRLYYIKDKKHLLQYKKRSRPHFVVPVLSLVD